MSRVAHLISAGVLLVDDDVGVLRMASDALAREGFGVVSTQSGAGALHHVNEGFRPNVLVASIRMPGISGIELADAIHDLSPTTSFVFMSESAAVVNSLERRNATVLVKPFEAIELISHVQALLPPTDVPDSSLRDDDLNDYFASSATPDILPWRSASEVWFHMSALIAALLIAGMLLAIV